METISTTTTTHSETCATNQSDTFSELPDNLFNFDEVAEVYKGDNVMNIEDWESLFPTDQTALIGSLMDDTGSSSAMADPGDAWSIEEWKDTAEHWKWCIEGDGWFQTPHGSHQEDVRRIPEGMEEDRETEEY